ncbi:hypothetical protein ZEAMMB73_Zm00001d039182 [Zea mays]|uniref:Uncharacterized protein n=1 Tax=Zea mays TaxID=4577 RepID=A0A1D6MEB3_MAIZE|nr:hypothetical protein ZEAMMB73_Zm00001d039182 [Zea mays]
MAGSAADAEQEQKRAAAAAYDYEGDARWAEYWSNVLVPPNLASRPDVVDHLKRKFYQRYIDHDLVVEPRSFTSSTQASRPDVRSSSSSSTENVRERNSGSTARSAPPPPPPTHTDSAVNPLRFDARTIHFSINAWILVVAGLGMLPILPKHLADRACKLSLLGTILSSGYSLYSTYGKPRAWNMPAIQAWLQSILATKDFIHLMFSSMLFTSQLHLKIAALPVFCWALDHVARFLRRNFARSSFYRWRRSIVQTFMYWQVLKLMYHAPVTSSYHQSTWAKIGRIVNPYIHRYAPFLQTPISAIQRWWFR